MHDDTPPTPQPPPAPDNDPAGIHKEVAETIAARTPEVRAAVVNHLVDECLTHRKKSVLDAIKMLEQARADIRKAQRSAAVYNADGKVVGHHFDRPQVESLLKVKDRAARIERCLVEALGPKAKYDRLQSLKA